MNVSQDPVHKVFNLLEQNSQFKRWLCAPDDKSGRLQAEFQLEKASRIGFVDIGNFGSAFVEVQVRRSSWPEGKSVTMLPATMMMTPQECRKGKNKCSVKMFTKDQLTAESLADSWDRIKVICTQPYKANAQFGLAFVRLAALSTEKETTSPEALGPTMTKLAASTKPSQSSTIKPANRPILSPSWKANAAFHRQVIAATKKEQNNNSELRNKLLKISATSENGTDIEASLSRSAKLVMAAASGKKSSPLTTAASGKKSSPVTTAAPARQETESSPAVVKNKSSTSVSERIEPFEDTGGVEAGGGEPLKRADSDKPFSDLVDDFLQSATDEKLKHSTLKALRREFEQLYGRKLNIPEKAEFKAKAILAVGCLVSDEKPVSSSKPMDPNTNKPRSTDLMPNLATPKRPKSMALTPPYSSTPKYKPNPTQSKGNAIVTPPQRQSFSNSPKHKLNHSQEQNSSSFTSSSKPSTAQQQKHLPKSQRKRPAPPDFSSVLGNGNSSGLGKAKIPRGSPTSGEAEDLVTPTWLQGTPSTSKVSPSTNTHRVIPPWMAAVNHSVGINSLPSPSAASAGTPTRGRGRGRGCKGQTSGRASTGERKPCHKCNKTFTAAGITRHMANCTGPKPRRQSRGRGGRGSRRSTPYCVREEMEENYPKPLPTATTPGTSNGANVGIPNSGPSQETASNFGLVTTDLVKCPVCLKDFPVTLIELHADMCAETDVVVRSAPNLDMPFNPIWYG